MTIRSIPRFAAAAGLAAALVLLCTGCERDKAVTAPHSGDPVPQMPYVPPQMPQAQADFLSLAGTSTDSDTFCAAFVKIKGFDDWSARVTDNEISTVNGAVDISFAIGGKVKLEEVVQKSDPLYATLSALRLGDEVRISGTFAHGNGECSYAGNFAVTVTKLAH